MARSSRWLPRHDLWLEAFVLLNLAGLAPDIYLAHSTNQFGARSPTAFGRRIEYLPLYFSPAAAAVLLAAVVLREAWGREGAWRLLGHLVGWAAVAVGVAGLVLHLRSQFFQRWTLASLVYSAPFAAPLAYAGLGLLLVMNRMVEPESEEWPRWVLLFALGGFVGNFVFSLADHAANGFFHKTEWIPVISAGLAVGFLGALFAVRVGRPYLGVCAGVLALQAVVGLLGFCLHAAADLRGPMPTLFENLVHGAPVLAPLLFVDLTVLGLIGLWVLRAHVSAATDEEEFDHGLHGWHG